MTNVALYGLGSMGFGMGLSLIRAGHAVHGFDVNPDAVARFQAQGGGQGRGGDVLGDVAVVVIAVVNAAQTTSVLFGDTGIARHLKAGTVVAGCATVPPATAIDLEARLAAAGILYLDAPMSGGAAKAGTGELTFMASGRPEAFDAASPALDAMAATVFRLGDRAGPGSAMKVVNQMLAGIHIAAMGEAITFAMTQGVSPQQFMDVIPKCAGTSWMLENRGPHVADGDYAPRSAVEIFVKDLGIVGDIAREARFAAPLTATALQQFVAASGMGYGREDDAAVAKVYARHVGLQLPGED